MSNAYGQPSGPADNARSVLNPLVSSIEDEWSSRDAIRFTEAVARIMAIYFPPDTVGQSDSYDPYVVPPTPDAADTDEEPPRPLRQTNDEDTLS